MICYLYQISFISLFLLFSPLYAQSKESPTLETKQFNTPITLKALSQTSFYTKVRDAYQSTTTPHHTIQKYLSNKKGPEQDIITFPEQFVINLPNASILGINGTVIAADNRPFFDYLHLERHPFLGEPDWKVKQAADSLSMQFQTSPVFFNGSIALVAEPADCCFYHWMFEALPRLKTLQMSGIPYDKVFVGSGKHKFKKPTLEAIGIPANKILYGEAETFIQANNVIIPSMPHLCAFTRPTWGCDFLREAFLDETITDSTTPRKRIFIARKYSTNEASSRFIVNEKELMTYLEPKGFEAVLLENLSNKEQAQLFNSAEIIIASHGAGLTNLVFCNSKLPVTVIELSPPYFVLECFSMLTEQLNKERGFQFNYIGYVTSNNKLSYQDRRNHNLYVELDQLDSLLNDAQAIIQ